MRLTDLIAGAGTGLTMRGDATDMDIVAISADSRDVAPGHLFAALPGTRADGRSFIADAVARGARAVLAPEGVTVDDDRVALITSADVRAALALLAARHAGAQPANAVAVTGTNGKTSVAEFTRQLWGMEGLAAAAIGTLGVPGRGPGLTTPDPVTLHGALAGLAADGVTHVSLEASSHGLDQRRLDGVRLRAAGFTNLSRDHLDYHASPEDYLGAKRRLFSELLPDDATAVLNADSPHFGNLSDAASGPVISYGRRGRDLAVVGMSPTPRGHDLRVGVFGRVTELEIPLIGAFQVANALCAAGLAVACGSDPATAIANCGRLLGVPGRLQLVGRKANGAPAFVDYAHTPDGIETALSALRGHGARRIVVVFGCGGDRDSGKRPLMGRAAARLADVVIVTDDNPRTEDAARIRAEILAAAPGAAEIADRAQAIAEGVRALGGGDMLVIAGKGHETGQIVGDTVLPFDDAGTLRDALLAAGGRVQ